MRKDQNLNFNVDEYGRVVIEDSELLELVSGAIIEDSMLEADGGCGNNNNCSNTSCG